MRMIVLGASGSGKTCFIKHYILNHPYLKFHIVNDFHNEYLCAKWEGKVCRDDWFGKKCTKRFENLTDNPDEADIIVYEWGDSPVPKAQRIHNAIFVTFELDALKYMGVPLDEILQDSTIVFATPYLLGRKVDDLKRIGVILEDHMALLDGNYYIAVKPIKQSDDNPVIKWINNVFHIHAPKPTTVNFALSGKQHIMTITRPMDIYIVTKEHADELARLL